MTIREQLMKIEAIGKYNSLDKLKEQEFDAYLKELRNFSNTLLSYEEVIKSSLEKKNHSYLANTLEKTYKLLLGIRTKELAERCIILSGAFTDIVESKSELNLEELKVELSAFLKDVSALSASIRAVMHKEQEQDSKEVYSGQPKLKKYSEVVKEYSILAVDDTSFFLERLKLFFGGTPYKITCVKSGKMALRFLSANKPDLFLLDIGMPEMDGFELAKEIRAMGITSPIIFLTSHSTKKSVLDAMKAGGSDFIIKPNTKEYIMGRVKAHLEGQNV